METLHLQAVGTLTQNKQFDDWWESTEIEIPYFDSMKLKVTLMNVRKDQIGDEYNSAINNFLALNSSNRLNASKYVYMNYTVTLKAVGEDQFDFKIDTDQHVWNHIKPIDIMVKKRKKDGLVYVIVEADCDWDDEHGIQIIYKDGNKLSRVSEQDGHLAYSDAHGLPESDNKIC